MPGNKIIISPEKCFIPWDHAFVHISFLNTAHFNSPHPIATHYKYSSRLLVTLGSSKWGFDRGNTRLTNITINLLRKYYNKGEHLMPSRLSGVPGGRVLNRHKARCKFLTKVREKVGHKVEIIFH